MMTISDAKADRARWRPVLEEKPLRGNLSIQDALKILRGQVADQRMFARLRNVIVEQIGNVRHHNPKENGLLNVQSMTVEGDDRGNFMICTTSLVGDRELSSIRRRFGSVINGRARGASFEDFFQMRLNKETRGRGLGLIAIMKEAGDPKCVGASLTDHLVGGYRVMELCTVLNHDAPLQ